MNTDTGDYRREDDPDFEKWLDEQKKEDVIRVKAFEEQMKKLSTDIKRLREIERNKKWPSG